MIDPAISCLPVRTNPADESRRFEISKRRAAAQPASKPRRHDEGTQAPMGAIESRCLSVRSGIEQVVARVFGVARGELSLATRGRAKVALARQVAMYLAHVVYSLSLTEVGRVFERDRTTVSYACGVVEDRRDDQTFDRVMNNLESIILVWSKRRAPKNDAC